MNPLPRRIVEETAFQACQYKSTETKNRGRICRGKRGVPLRGLFTCTKNFEPWTAWLCFSKQHRPLHHPSLQHFIEHRFGEVKKLIQAIIFFL